MSLKKLLMPIMHPVVESFNRQPRHSKPSVPPIVDEPHPAIALLKKYGNNAHMWFPGVGVVHHVDAANWSDDGVTPAQVGDGVARVDDSASGTITASQTVAAVRPVLADDSSWALNGTSDYFRLSGPAFTLDDDFCIVAGIDAQKKEESQTIFAQSKVSNYRLPFFALDHMGRLDFYTLGGGSIINVVGTEVLSGTGKRVVSAVGRSKEVKIRTDSTQVGSGMLSGTYFEPEAASLGAFYSLNPMFFMKGNLHPVIVIKGTVSDADLLVFEDFVRVVMGA